MSRPVPMVPMGEAIGEDVALTLTHRGVTYDASGTIGDLTITVDHSTGVPVTTLTLTITQPSQIVARRPPLPVRAP